MLLKVSNNLKRLFNENRIVFVSNMLGFLSGVCIFFFLMFGPSIDRTQYTSDDIQELYIQKELVDAENYNSIELEDFKFNKTFNSDNYEITYENSEVSITEYINYNGKIEKQVITDKKIGLFNFILVLIILPVATFAVVAAASRLIMLIIYEILYKKLIVKLKKLIITKLKRRK